MAANGMIRMRRSGRNPVRRSLHFTGQSFLVVLFRRYPIGIAPARGIAQRSWPPSLEPALLIFLVQSGQSFRVLEFQVWYASYVAFTPI